MRGLIGQAPHGAHQPSLQIRLRHGDHAHAHHALGRPFRQRQGDQRTAKTENGRENQQAAQPPASQMYAENLLDDEEHRAEQGQHGQVRYDEEKNALHKPFLCANQPQYRNAARHGSEYGNTTSMVGDAAVGFQGAARQAQGATAGDGFGGSLAGWTDELGYVLVISTNNLVKGGHAV